MSQVIYQSIVNTPCALTRHRTINTLYQISSIEITCFKSLNRTTGHTRGFFVKNLYGKKLLLWLRTLSRSQDFTILWKNICKGNFSDVTNLSTTGGGSHVVLMSLPTQAELNKNIYPCALSVSLCETADKGWLVSCQAKYIQLMCSILATAVCIFAEQLKGSRFKPHILWPCKKL